MFSPLVISSQRNHPCFNSESKGFYGRIHLPVAPSCNIQCAYCHRDYDCVHENRPGTTCGVLSPEEATERLEKAIRKMPNISVAGIAGPGDAFDTPQLTLETFEYIRRKDFKIDLCVSTNGLNLVENIHSLLQLKVHFVTVTINAIDPGIGSVLYKKVQSGNGVIKGREAAELLIQKQMEAVSALKAAGFTVKVNSVVVPGVNDCHIPLVAKRMQNLGVDLMNLIPLIPLPGTDMEEFDPPHPSEMTKLRKIAGRYVDQMYHCKRCRSDAVGLLGEGYSEPGRSRGGNGWGKLRNQNLC